MVASLSVQCVEEREANGTQWKGQLEALSRGIASLLLLFSFGIIQLAHPS